MEETNSDISAKRDSLTEDDAPVKWDYTSSRGNMVTGAMVVGGNLALLITYLLYRSVPAVHQFISGKPL